MNDKKSITSEAKKKVAESEKLQKVESIGEKIIKTIGVAGELAVPGSSIAGSLVSQGFSKVMIHYANKKEKEIIIEIIKGLEELEKRLENFQVQNMNNEEKFGATVLQVLPLALRSLDEEKILALRNVVLNTAIGNSPDEDLHQIILNHLESFTGWHIKILEYFWAPQGWFQARKKTIPNFSMGSASAGLESAFPELKERPEFYNAIVKELISKNLMSPGEYLHVSMTGSGIWERRVTNMGRQLLDLIKNPLE